MKIRPAPPEAPTWTQKLPDLPAYVSANKLKVAALVVGVGMAVFALLKYLFRPEVKTNDTVDAKTVADLPLEKKRPTLDAHLNTSLNHAGLHIQLSEGHPASKVNLLFCRDSRGDEKCEQEKSLRDGYDFVCKKAAELQTGGSAETQVSLIQYSNETETLCDPTIVTEDNLASLNSILFSYTSNKVTSDPLKALESSAETLEKMAASHQGATQALIFISGKKGKVDLVKLAEISDRLAKIGTRVLVIGTPNHSKETLQSIAATFNATYVDASDQRKNFSKTVIRAYLEAIAPYTDLVLRTSSLKAGTWSLDKKLSEETDDGSQSKVESFFPLPAIKSSIHIYPDKLSDSLDTSTLTFDLCFNDSSGERHSLSIPWKTNSVIVPDPSKL